MIFRKTILYSVILLLGLAIAACSTVDFKSNNGRSAQFQSADSSEINLLTYNIKAIYEKEEDQIDSLMTFVNKGDFDFVVFQELFDESTRENIIRKADKRNFNTFISRVDYNSFPEFIFQDAGLFMMSRYPRIDLSNIDFGSDIKNSNGVIHRILDKEISRTNDFLANKSVLGALFQINDTTKLFLFTAHVQAAGTLEHKLYQLEQIGDFITRAVKETVGREIIKNPDNLTVLLAGDFNSNAYDINRFNSFTKALHYPKDVHKEFHGVFEENSFRNRYRRYDYVLTYDIVENFELNKISTKAANVVNIKDGKGESISDHKGIKASFLLKQFILTEKKHENFNIRSGK